MKMSRKSGKSPVAVTGYACRLPGARNASEFWSLMSEGRCAVTPIPLERWDTSRFHHEGRAMAGTSYTTRAGLIDDVWAFDPAFFGISPREAEQMDPQQRGLLEVVWEAVEHAMLSSSALSRTKCGVFVGAASIDHSLIMAAEPAQVGPNFMTGNTLSILSNRISYALDLKGPSYTVDTACSSSFYALHQAMEALQKGEIDTAIVAGVNLILSPFNFVGFSRAAMLSPEGLCKAFDATADGYVRGEGVVAFVLRREDALSAEEPIRASLLGTGVNSDGRTMGLSMPSGEDQARLLADVYTDLNINPDHVAFVEAHGTGTNVGDPIEARAIGEVVGQKRREPLLIGSAKTNVGHLEAASGLVGLLKAQLALEHRQLPPSLHFNTPNPEIPFDELNLKVAATTTAIAKADHPWIAGVNSFGFGGANAHAVIAEGRRAEPPRVTRAAAQPPLILTAASEASLHGLASSWRKRLQDCPATEAASLISANARLRTRHSHRAVLTGQGADLDRQLDALSTGGSTPGCLTGEAQVRGGKTAFVFCGNGAQWVGMGQELYDNDAAYRRSFDKVSKAFTALSGLSLVKLMAAEDLSEQMDNGLVGQPLLLGLQIALVEALAARGLKPDAVAGHSVGEVAATWAAGCLSLKDACRLIHVRASAMEALRGEGGMAAVLAGADATALALEEMGFTDLDIAGDNSPRSSTISGPATRIAEFVAAAKARRLAVRQIPVTYPYHGPAMERIRERLLTDLQGLTTRKGRIPVFSATTGQMTDGLDQTADYWWLNARQKVRFREAVAGLAELGATTFVEIGPRPQLQAYVNDTARALGKKVNAIASLDGPSKPADAQLIVARALANGAAVDEAVFFGPARHPVESLPAYPWSHQTYRAPVTENGIDLLGKARAHPLLGWQLRPGEGVWRADVDAVRQAWLADHVVDGAIVLPGAGFVEIALAAAAEGFATDQVELRDFDILAPLMLEENGTASTTLRTQLERETGIIRIESRPFDSEQDWVLHARGTVGPARTTKAVPEEPGLALLPEWPGERLYSVLDAAGLSYGPAFRRVSRLRAGGGWAEADLAAPDDADRFQIHPAILDSAFHAVFPLIAAEATQSGQTQFGATQSGTAIRLGDGDSFVPVRFGHVTSLAPGKTPHRADLRLVRLSAHGAEVALTLRSESGEVLARVEGLRLQKIRLKAQREAGAHLWHQRLLPHRRSELPTVLPAGWDAPARRLAELGLISDESAEPDAGALIADAGFRRVAYEALAGLADANGHLAAVPEQLAENALPLYHRLCQALEEDDAVARDGDNAVLLDCPLPRLADLTDALISEAPERAADLMDLMRATTGLSDALHHGLADGPVQRAQRHAPSHRALWRAGEGVATAIATDWSGAEPLEIVLIGDAPIDLVERLLALPRITRLNLTDTEAARVDRLRLAIPAMPGLVIAPWEELQTTARADLVLAVDALGRFGRTQLALLGDALRPEGLLIALERSPDLAADISGGLAVDWWSETLIPQTPLGRLNAGEEWRNALSGAGFDNASTSRLPSPDVAASVIMAQRPLDWLANAGDDVAVAQQDAAQVVHVVGRIAPLAGLSTKPVAPDDLISTLADPSVSTLVIAPDLTGGRIGVVEAHTSLCKALAGNPSDSRKVWIAVEGGSPGDGSPLAALIWGMTRTLMNEDPSLDIRLVDTASCWDGFADLLANAEDEREWVLTTTGPQVVRVEALTEPAAGDRQSDSLSLGMRREGSLDTLEWQPAERRRPGADEIEIRIVATGLNFRDVMWGQRLLPAEALEDGFAGATLGMECAGVVMRAGGSSGFEEGQKVIAFAPQAFASHATVPATSAAPLPAGLSFEMAAALPTIFLTAHYSLIELARLQPGEVVLVHGGAGGVGLAALQIAKSRGARVFATAGSPQKRALLTLLGADQVYDSRSLEFVEQVRAATDGEGVDIVLNSLAGEAMIRSLDLVRPFGRFIELGKQDFYGNTRLGLRPFRQNISYFGVDADQLVSARPELAERMFNDLADRFGNGTYTAPPIQVFEPGEVVEAFRLMQKSDHVGKIVIRVPEIAAEAPADVQSLGEGGWLITGGLSGIGVAMAEWLVEQGVETLWLTSRKGQPAPDVASRITSLSRRADVTMVAADVTDPAAMQSLAMRIEDGGVALEGVIHSAMVLEDALLSDMSVEAADRVVAPKVAGAMLLDQVTRPLAPDHFILFSSVAALFGNPGQAAYNAANMALEALAHGRRKEGLPALAIGWGPIGDQGYLSREEDLRDRLARQLKGAILETDRVLDAFGRLIRDPSLPPAVTFAPMRWGALVDDLRVVSSPLFERVDRSVQKGAASAQDFLDEIAGLDDVAARERIVAALITETARILRQSESEIDAYRPMSDLGFDSLMAVDLKLSAEEELGVALPLMSLGEQLTITDLAIKVLERIKAGETGAEEDAGNTLMSRHAGIDLDKLDDSTVRSVAGKLVGSESRGS